ncbi:archease [Amycolatopsis cynarae]|uniref:Archease n=1 Tax=Amycolatopsis cynarae TaxID=2995223 RepID=A0ABY7AT78_9PSEU|nr:archease [Amycolatopsis sp. HUAS 11-8]WAL63152.1 archease [Amycolatopsis sp. HUAS 11-8]
MTAGHRALPRTAGLRIEAWGPTREDCLAEAALALVESFAVVTGRAPTRTISADLLVGTGEEALIALLDEIIYRLDTEDVLPVGVRVLWSDTGVEARLAVVDRREAEITGPAPKAVAWHGLRFAEDEAGIWRCLATIDL